MLSCMPWLTAALWLLGSALFVWVSNTLRYIPNKRVGIVERLWSPRGSVKKGFHCPRIR
jgi:hypothetical protein